MLAIRLPLASRCDKQPDRALTQHAADVSEDASRDVDVDGPGGAEAESEQDPSASDPFFVSKSAAAVLKHGILTRYLPPFISKVGSTSAGNRVALLDGYAGPGRYGDNTPGSPALLAETAKAARGYRRVECHFVEQKHAHYRRLGEFLVGEGSDLAAKAYYGSVEQHLDTVLSAAAGLPLFAYLDPFGFGIPFGDVVRTLRRYSRPHEPATEVLLNFTANGIRRSGGLLRPGRVISAGDEKTLERSDLACGGAWWRDVVRKHDVLEDAVQAVATGYMRLVCAQTRMTGFAVPVRKREHHKPVYYLIFFTRHPDGMWLFNEAVSGASEDWRRVLAPPPWEPDPGMLFDVPTEPSFEEEEKQRAGRWVEEIEGNIERVLLGGPFVIGEKLTDVYGSALGEAREKHVREALKHLHQAGRTVSDKKGDLQRKKVVPPA